MAEVFDFGLQQHKIKMDGKFFENNLFAVAGDTGRRLEVQLLNSDNMVQNTTGISLRLNANVAGQATYAEAVLVDATKGLYELDLPNGMLIAPGNWQFQWQIIGTSGEKLHSFAFTGSVGSNLSEGGSEAINFYLNVDDLKQMQEDLVNGTFDSEVLETSITEKLTNLETQYAPKLTEVTKQLAPIDGAFSKSLGYLFVKNIFSANPDQPTRFAVIPKGETTTGVGGVFKIFADDFSVDQINYRDIGMYFSQNQRGDQGHNDGGVFWFNSKVGIDGKFLDKNPDMAFSFQDGETVGGRFILDTSTGVDNAVFVVGSEKSKYAPLFSGLAIPIGMEIQKDVYVQPDRMIRFANELDDGLHGIRYNSTTTKLEVIYNGSVATSFSTDGNEFRNAKIIHKYNSIAAGNSVLDGTVGGVYVVSDTTAITTVNGGANGQEIRVLFASAGGILKNSASLKLKSSADFIATTALSSVKLLKINSGWIEVSRNIM